MLQEYNSQIVADAAELRQVTINKLLDLTMCGDPRIEIKATELLGKVSDVGLFTEKTEITVTYNSVSDIDNAIKDKIRKMMRLHAQEVTTIDLDVEKELGLTPAIEYTDIVPKDLFEEPEEPEDA
jgi:PHP family Zn ribbon phosphoesterase